MPKKPDLNLVEKHRIAKQMLDFSFCAEFSNALRNHGWVPVILGERPYAGFQQWRQVSQSTPVQLEIVPGEGVFIHYACPLTADGRELPDRRLFYWSNGSRRGHKSAESLVEDLDTWAVVGYRAEYGDTKSTAPAVE